MYRCPGDGLVTPLLAPNPVPKVPRARSVATDNGHCCDTTPDPDQDILITGATLEPGVHTLQQPSYNIVYTWGPDTLECLDSRVLK